MENNNDHDNDHVNDHENNQLIDHIMDTNNDNMFYNNNYDHMLNSEYIKKIIFEGVKRDDFIEDCLICFSEINNTIHLTNPSISLQCKLLYKIKVQYEHIQKSPDFITEDENGMSYIANIVLFNNELFFLYNLDVKKLTRLHLFDISYEINKVMPYRLN